MRNSGHVRDFDSIPRTPVEVLGLRGGRSDTRACGDIVGPCKCVQCI